MTLALPMFPPGADTRINGTAPEPLICTPPADLPAATSDVYVRTDISPEILFEALGRLRSEAEAAIERLIAIVDAIDGESDLEPAGDETEPDLGSTAGRKGLDQSTWSAGDDAEPSLAGAETSPRPGYYFSENYRDTSGSQLGWSTGNVDDREHCVDREEDDSHDGREPFDGDDELSGDESEPQLGSFDRLLNQDHGWRQTAGDQRTWPAHHNGDYEYDLAN